MEMVKVRCHMMKNEHDRKWEQWDGNWSFSVPSGSLKSRQFSTQHPASPLTFGVLGSPQLCVSIILSTLQSDRGRTAGAGQSIGGCPERQPLVGRPGGERDCHLGNRRLLHHISPGQQTGHLHREGTALPHSAATAAPSPASRHVCSFMSFSCSSSHSARRTPSPTSSSTTSSA